MTRILLTGAGGFIGSRLVRQALEKGAELAVLLRSGGNPARLGKLLNRVKVFHGLLEDLPALAPELAAWRPEAFVHLAWTAEPGRYQRAPENLSFLSWSLRALEVLRDAGCDRFVVAGTCAECEPSERIAEDAVARPETLYAACKHALRIAGERWAKEVGARFAWGRIFYLYGPGEDPRRAVPAAIRSLLEGKEFGATEGLQVRDYLHVDDAAAAFLRLAEAGAEGVFNVCSGEPLTIRRLLQMVGELLGREDLLRFGAVAGREWDPPFVCGENRKLKAMGWEREYDLVSGLKDTIEAWRGRSAAKERP